MRVDVTDLEQSKKAVTIEIPEEIVTRKINDAFRQVSFSTKIKGFRPGKAPKDLLRARFWDKIESGVINDLVPEYFEKAVEEQRLQLIGQPEFEGELHIQEHEPLSFKVIVTTWPRVELPQNYREIEVAQEKVEVTEEDVMAMLNDLQEQSAKYQVIADRSIREGDLVIFDYSASEKENPSWSESKKDAMATVGSRQIPPGFSENIIGMAKGEEKEFEEAFPADYSNRELAGKKISFKINIKEIKEKVLPAIDDDFAKDWGNDSLATLREEIAATIKKRREEEARQKMANSLLSTLLDSTSVDSPPELLVENETEVLIEDVDLQLASQGRKLDKSEQNLVKLRIELREPAIRNVKASMILEEVAVREGIKVPPEEIDHQIQLLAKQYNKTTEEVKKVKGKIEKSLQERKTLDFLLDHAGTC